MPDSITSPMRSATAIQDTWKNREKPRPNSSKSSKVAPVKPKDMARWPMVLPITPPGASGNCTLSDHMRSASMPMLPANIRAKPIQRITGS